jgi:putative hydrolase of the HAD superfamily
MPFPYQDTHESATTPISHRVDTVLFDFGMVLSGPPDPTAWAVIRSITGLDEERLHTAYWAFRHDYDRGTLTGHAYWRAVAAHAGIPLDDAQIAALSSADVDLWTTLNAPMVEWAARLQHAGVRTGILSNIGDSIAEGIIARLPWLAGFNHCTWSHSLFMAKPEPAIYIKTAEALSTRPANILFLDDKPENLVAARAVGMQAILYASHPVFERDMREGGFSYLLDVDPAPLTDATRATATAQ